MWSYAEKIFWEVASWKKVSQMLRETKLIREVTKIKKNSGAGARIKWKCCLGGIVKQRKEKMDERNVAKDHMMHIRSLSWTYTFHFDLSVNPSNCILESLLHTQNPGVSLYSRNYRKRGLPWRSSGCKSTL